MEHQVCSILFFLALFFLGFALLKRRKEAKTHVNISNLPPGPWKLPIIGSLHHLISRKSLHHTIEDLAKKHGPLMHLKLGQLCTIVISSPEIVKEVLDIHDEIFSDRPSNLHAKNKAYGFLGGVSLLPYGTVWRQGRRICSQELLSLNRVKSFQFLIEEEVSNLITSISASCDIHVNLNDKLFLLTSSIISRAIFGKKYRNHDRFLSTMRKLLKLTFVANISDLYPSMRFLDKFSPSVFKLKATYKQLNKILEEIIEDHKRQRDVRKDTQEELENKEEEDMVHVLIRLKEMGELENYDIKSIISEMFVAGTEAIALSIINVMSELVKNPRVMLKAQAEVRKVLAGDEKLDKRIIDELSYFNCVLKETFRYHPVGPFLFPRENRESCKISGYMIPAKTQVLVHSRALARDPRYWEDAESFYPERFHGSSVNFKGTNFEYIPFGTGRRICPGMTFALSVMELTLVPLLYHFNWELPNGLNAEELDMTESLVGFQFQRKNDLLLSATPYAPM